MNFAKMHGIGNDFIVTHQLGSATPEITTSQIQKLCARRTGIGADGVIFILPSDEADFCMRIFNADGSEAEMCGNGIRCAARYLYVKDLYILPRIRWQTGAGLITTEKKEDLICVNMGPPVLEADKIPTTQESGRVQMVPLEVEGREFRITAVSMGNPHAVIYADELTDDLVLNRGSKIECHAFFPNRVNVEWVRVISAKEIEMRVYERGCGETLACGTGACASVVAGILNNLHGKDVTVHLLGGDLRISWSGNQIDPVYMTGPAELVCVGEVDMEA